MKHDAELGGMVGTREKSQEKENDRYPIMPEPPDGFHAAVRERFTKIARTPQQETARPVGPERAKSLGYDPDEIDALSLAVTESFCGVGNPLALGGPDIARRGVPKGRL